MLLHCYSLEEDLFEQMQSLPSWPLNRCSAPYVQKIRCTDTQRRNSHVLHPQFFLNICLLLAIYTRSCTWPHRTRKQSWLVFIAHQVLSFQIFLLMNRLSVIFDQVQALFKLLFFRIVWVCLESPDQQEISQISLQSLLLYLFLEVIWCTFWAWLSSC